MSDSIGSLRVQQLDLKGMNVFVFKWPIQRWVFNMNQIRKLDPKGLLRDIHAAGVFPVLDELRREIESIGYFRNLHFAVTCISIYVICGTRKKDSTHSIKYGPHGHFYPWSRASPKTLILVLFILNVVSAATKFEITDRRGIMAKINETMQRDLSKSKPKTSKASYKKTLSKKEEAAKKRERAFNLLAKQTANCGEDTVALSIKAAFCNFDLLRTRMDRRTWSGEKFAIADQVLPLNGFNFLPNPPDREQGGKKGRMNWAHVPAKYKYHYAGYQFGFIGTDIPMRPKPEALPNVYVKLGCQALERGIFNCNNVLKAIFADTFKEVWSTITNRMDTYIDVQKPMSYFHNLHARKQYKSLLKGKASYYGTSHAEQGNPVKYDKETLVINDGGDVQIHIYDKGKELRKAGNEKKREIYERKHGPLPAVLTRIEIRLHRNYLRSRGIDIGRSIDTIDDWLKCREAMITEIMTKQFRFIAEDGKTLPLWEWALNQFTQWATDENKCHGMPIHPVKVISSKTKLNVEKKIVRKVSELRTLLIEAGYGPNGTKEEFALSLTKAFSSICEFNKPEFELNFFSRVAASGCNT